MSARTTTLLAVVLLAATVLISILLGGETHYTPGEFFTAVIDYLAADEALREDMTADERILLRLRAPRAFSAALVGCALALSGVLMQGLFRNPLASPGILGATAGGTFAAVVAISLGLAARSVLWVPLISFAGSTLAIGIVYLLAGRGTRLSSTHLILSGVAVNTVFSAGASLVLTLAVADHEVTRQIVHWLTGGLQLSSWSYVILLVVAFGLALLGSRFVARDLNLLLVGEESAHSLGVRLPILRRRAIVLTALATGAAVSVAGMVGFVGLVIPHIARFLLGPDHRRLLLGASLFGGAFLVLADLATVKVLPGQEIQLGIMTSLVGGPFFLYLIIRERKKADGDA